MWEIPYISDALGENTYKIVWTVLWVLLSLVTVSLLTFARAKPLSKCVFLSLFAHILLLGHAYMINLDRPSLPGHNVVSVTLRDDPFDRTPPEAREIPEWDKHVTDNVILPKELAMARELIDNQQVQPERTDDATPSVAIGVPTEMAFNDQVRFQGEQPQVNKSIHQQSTGATAAEINAIQAERRDEATPTGPVQDRVDAPQREIGENNPLHRSSTGGVPDEILNATPDVQRLSDANNADPADALRSPNDITSATLNRTVPGIHDAISPSVAPSQAMPEEMARVNDTHSGAEGDRPNRSPGDDASQGSSAEGPTRTASPKRLANGKPLPNIYELRVQVDRGAIARRNGGNERTEAAVAAALKWLAANQEADGRWDADKHGAGRETRVFGHNRDGAGAQSDTAVTALAVLAFMAAGNSHYEGEYRKNVQHGLEFILNSRARNGNLAGEAKLFAQMYSHGMATLAIAEAYAITGDERLRPGVETAIAFTLATQHATDGGWRYRPGDEGDMSQFGWQVMALKAAEHGGIEIPAKTREGMSTFITRCSSGRSGGLASYRPREDVSATMTAEALSCRFFMNLHRADATVEEAANYLDARRPADGKADLYYWYYGTLAMHQLGGPRWDRWNVALQQQLLPRQRREGRLAGSWDPNDTVWGGYGGRVYSTAMGALCLEAYYRFAVE